MNSIQISILTFLALTCDLADAKPKYKASKSKSKKSKSKKSKTKIKFKISGGGGDGDDDDYDHDFYNNNDHYNDDHVKYKIDDDYDRNSVGCEPWKFTFLQYEDQYCDHETYQGFKQLSDWEEDAIRYE